MPWRCPLTARDRLGIEFTSFDDFGKFNVVDRECLPSG